MSQSPVGFSSAEGDGFADALSPTPGTTNLAEGLYGGPAAGKQGASLKGLSKFADLQQRVAAELENYEILASLETYTGVRKLDILAWTGAALSLSFALGFGARHWCGVVAFMYPVHATLVLLSSKEKTRGNVARWMMYWLIVSFLHIMEDFLGGTLLRIVPFYYAFKFGFVLWCQSPQKKGSLYAYTHMLAPFLKRHQAATPLKVS
jgi:hypothetical protein